MNWPDRAQVRTRHGRVELGVEASRMKSSALVPFSRCESFLKSPFLRLSQAPIPKLDTVNGSVNGVQYKICGVS